VRDKLMIVGLHLVGGTHNHISVEDTYLVGVRETGNGVKVIVHW
jgi:hypothetical protein